MATHSPSDTTTQPPTGARERILQAAYELFSQNGIHAVGIDRIISRSGVAKMSLYRHFRSKEELVLAFMKQREALWTRQWLEAEITAMGERPTDRLLAVFSVFDQWFRKPDFEGCSFINVLLESTTNSPIHHAAAAHLAEIRMIISEQADQAGLSHPEEFAQVWHFLKKGCIISANEGNRSAAQQARQAGAILLEHWPRRESGR